MDLRKVSARRVLHDNSRAGDHSPGATPLPHGPWRLHMVVLVALKSWAHIPASSGAYKLHVGKYMALSANLDSLCLLCHFEAGSQSLKPRLPQCDPRPHDLRPKAQGKVLGSKYCGWTKCCTTQKTLELSLCLWVAKNKSGFFSGNQVVSVPRQNQEVITQELRK